jgi:hypothetical protein
MNQVQQMKQMNDVQFGVREPTMQRSVMDALEAAMRC